MVFAQLSSDSHCTGSNDVSSYNAVCAFAYSALVSVVHGIIDRSVGELIYFLVL